jgi:hypothetical protein
VEHAPLKPTKRNGFCQAGGSLSVNGPSDGSTRDLFRIASQFHLSLRVGDVFDRRRFRTRLRIARKNLKGQREGLDLPFHPVARIAIGRWFVQKLPFTPVLDVPSGGFDSQRLATDGPSTSDAVRRAKAGVSAFGSTHRRAAAKISSRSAEFLPLQIPPCLNRGGRERPR